MGIPKTCHLSPVGEVPKHVLLLCLGGSHMPRACLENELFSIRTAFVGQGTDPQTLRGSGSLCPARTILPPGII